MIAFHQSERLSAAALDDLSAVPPAQLPLAMACRARFALEGAPCRYHHLHAALTFLGSESLSHAARSLAKDRQMPVWRAGGSILSALDEAADLFLSHKEMLLQKGVVQAGGRFRAAGDSPQSREFCRALSMIAPRLRPVAESVLCSALRPASNAVPERLLPFVAAQLLPPGTERQIRFNALSVTVPRRAHAECMTQAATQITRHAEKCGLMVGPQYFESVAQPPAAKPRSAGPEHARSAAPAPDGLAARIATQIRAVEAQVLGLFRAS